MDEDWKKRKLVSTSSTALEGINNILEINLGSRSFQGLGLHQMSCPEPFLCFLVFFPIFKQVLLQLFRRMLEHCYVVKLQKCFSVYKTSPNFQSTRGWVDNDKLYFIFWMNFFLTILSENFVFTCFYLFFFKTQGLVIFPLLMLFSLWFCSF